MLKYKKYVKDEQLTGGDFVVDRWFFMHWRLAVDMRKDGTVFKVVKV
jgi:hypothetical protein